MMRGRCPPEKLEINWKREKGKEKEENEEIGFVVGKNRILSFEDEDEEEEKKKKETEKKIALCF